MFTQWKGNVFKNAKISKKGAELKQHAHATARNHEFGSRGTQCLNILANTRKLWS